MLYNSVIMPGMPVTTTTISTFGYGRPCMPPSIFGGYPMMGCGIGMPMMGGCCCGGGINPMLQIAGGFALGSALANSGIITSLFNCIGNAVGWTWNNVIQPGANWAWNNVLQPFGNWAWNSVLKPTGQWIGATASNLYNGAKEKIADAKEAAAAKKAAKAAEQDA